MNETPLSRYPDILILAVKINHSVFVVVTETTIYIHNSDNMSMIHQIKSTPSNCVIALSPVQSKPWLAYPVSGDCGNVQLFDFHLRQNISVVKAHQNTIAAINFNSDCTMMATASNEGDFVMLLLIKHNKFVIKDFAPFSVFVKLVVYNVQN